MAIRNITELNVELIPTITVKTDEIVNNDDMLSMMLSDSSNISTASSEWATSNQDAGSKERSSTQGGDAADPAGNSSGNKIPKIMITSQLQETVPNELTLTDKVGTPDLSSMGDAVILTPNLLNNTLYPTQLERNEVHHVIEEVNHSSTTNTLQTPSITNYKGEVLKDDGTSLTDSNGKIVMTMRRGAKVNLEPKATQITIANSKNSELRIYTDTLCNRSATTQSAAATDLRFAYTPNIWSSADLEANKNELKTVSVQGVAQAMITLGTSMTVASLQNATTAQQTLNEVSTTTQYLFSESFGGSVTYHKTLKGGSPDWLCLLAGLQSEFYLRKNQPFGFYFDQTKTNQYLIQNGKSSDIKFETVATSCKALSAAYLTDILSNENQNDNVMIIEFGAHDAKNKESRYALVFQCKQSVWSLYKEIGSTTTETVKSFVFDSNGNPVPEDYNVTSIVNGVVTIETQTRNKYTTSSQKTTTYKMVLVGGPYHLEGCKSYTKFSVMVYPIGNQIVLSTDVSTKEKKTKRNTITFDFDTPVFVGEGKMRIFFYGMYETSFKFLPVYHSPIGGMVSTLKEYNCDSPVFLLKARYGGVVGCQPLNLSNTNIGFPHVNDKNKRYSYLSNSRIYYGAGNVNDDWYADFFTDENKSKWKKAAYHFFMYSNENNYDIKYKDDIEGNDIDIPKEIVNQLVRQYSPALYSANLLVVPPTREITLIEDGITKLSYVKSASITQTVEGYSGSVTLYNKQTNPLLKEGLYTSNYKIKGIKPIKIDAKIKTTDTGVVGDDATSEISDPTTGKWNRVFTGYLTARNFSRSSGKNPAASTVTLTLEDATMKAKDTFVICTPPFDGQCHLSVMYFLGKYAGYTDDELLLWQDPYNESSKIRIVDQLVGGPSVAAVFGGACFDGHVEGFPRQQLQRLRNSSILGSSTGNRSPQNKEKIGLSGDQLHACLPMTNITEAPNYFFQMGTPVWDCMREVCEFTGFYLFANNWGNLVYCPPELAISPYVDFEFVEMPGDASFESISNFNEIQQQLAVDNPTAEMRNYAMSQGLIIEGNDPMTQNVSPMVSIRKQDGWPTNVKDENYIPWLRIMIQRNPHWSDPKRLQWLNDQLFIRASRKRAQGKWQAWGRALYPYQIFQISESHLNETGMNTEKFICSSITHTFEGENFMWNIGIDAERYEDKFEFTPHMA